MASPMPSARRSRRLRRSGFDELGLRRAVSDRMLPFLVGAMAFLAALALGGWIAAASLAQHWRLGAAAAMTVQVPHPADPAAQGGGTRVARVVALLNSTSGIAEARALTDDELADLLRPWLGSGVERLSIPLPAVIQVHLSQDGPDLDALDRALNAVAPGTLTETHGVWIARLTALARSLQACAGAALLVVAGVAVSVIAVATRAGLSARRDAIEIVHGLGATDGYIAARFAGRATMLAALGGLAGAVAALPVLLGLAQLSAPFAAGPVVDEAATSALAALPPGLWVGLPALPLVAAGIGFLTAQGTVRRWLRRLP
jgi:cell division transport system permease protein